VTNEFYTRSLTGICSAACRSTSAPI